MQVRNTGRSDTGRVLFMRGGTILIGKTFSTIPATDDPTVAETFAKDGSPHDTVVPMRIDPD